MKRVSIPAKVAEIKGEKRSFQKQRREFSMTWSSLGESLFPNPGTFTLVLRVCDMELAPIEVHVFA